MGNKDFLTIFISVLAATLFFYGASAGGALALNSAFTSKHNFGNQSYIGIFDVSNLKEDEAKQLLAEGFQKLEEDFNFLLIYQDVTVELPVETITYEVDQTADLAETGIENPIKTSVNVEALRTFLNQQFESVLFTDEDVMNIADGIQHELEIGVMPSKVYINDLMESAEFLKEEITQANLLITTQPQGLDKIVKSLDGIEIEPFATFSLLDYIENRELGLINNEALTLIASVLYDSVLQTNFAVDERSIGEVLHPTVPIGYEASINQLLGIDFVFTNSNKSSFKLNIRFSNQQLTISFTGLPFIYTYQTTVTPIMEFKQGTIEQFSAMISKHERKIAQEGKSGQEVTVKKLTFDKGDEIEQVIISTDYYAPIPRIEILPLRHDDPPEDESETNASNDTDSESSNDAGDTSSEEGSANGKINSGGSNENGKNPAGEPNADEKPEVQYDKGGNVIE